MNEIESIKTIESDFTHYLYSFTQLIPLLKNLLIYSKQHWRL